jgi:hypothetical protein
MSLSALRFSLRNSPMTRQAPIGHFRRGIAKNKYRRFTMGKVRQLQRNALGGREKNGWRKNNGYQWKNNANNNGNNEKYRGVTRFVARRRTGNGAARVAARRAGFAYEIRSLGAIPGCHRSPEKAKQGRSDGAPDEPTSLCTYCHALTAPEMQAGFNLSPLFRRAPVKWAKHFAGRAKQTQKAE